jgi:hypothetical protein
MVVGKQSQLRHELHMEALTVGWQEIIPTNVGGPGLSWVGSCPVAVAGEYEHSSLARKRLDVERGRT